MNVSPEHAQVIRDALAAGLTECWLVVPADVAGDVTSYWVPPADWVALTGACEPCDGEGCFHEERAHSGGDVGEVIVGYCEACDRDGLKRATLTVACDRRHRSTATMLACDLAGRTVPLAVATVEVLPVNAYSIDTGDWCPKEPHAFVDEQRVGGKPFWTLAYCDGTGEVTVIADADEPPARHGRDYVIHLTHVVAP